MKEQNFYTDTLEDRSIIRRPGEGQTFGNDGVSTTFKVTSGDSNDRIGVYEATIGPGRIGAKLHYHRYMDETFIITGGTLTIQLAERQEKVSTGSVIYIPRFTPHGFRNETEESVSMILVFNPAHKREGFIKGLYKVLGEEPVDSGKFLKLFHKYDSYPVDPKNMLPLSAGI